MASILRIALCFLICALPQLVSANIGVLRAGEHGDFTRITVSLLRDVTELRHEQLGPTTFALVISPAPTGLDSSRLFDRIDRSRLKSIVQTDRGFELSVNCKCQPTVVLQGPNLIVVDVFDDVDLDPDTLPIFPDALGGVPRTLHELTPSALRNETFQLDYSVVDRVSRKVSSRLAETFQVEGFSELAPAILDSAGHDSLSELINVPGSRVGPASRCLWSAKVWGYLEGTSIDVDKEAQYGRLPVDLSHFDNLDALFDAEAIRFLASGRLEEARVVIMLTEKEFEEIDAYDAFERMIAGAFHIESQRFGDCNPLDDILLAAMRRPSDIPNRMKIATMVTFEKLPLGLQIILFPRLEELFSELSENAFPEVKKHLRTETALAYRMPMEQIESEYAPDPDTLAALTVELRGTDLEIESWHASFLSYLENGRYFDAVSSLSTDTPLSRVDRQRAVTDLVDHLVSYAETVTFVQIALASVPYFDPPPSQKALVGLKERLEKEGFAPLATSTDPTGKATHDGSTTEMGLIRDDTDIRTFKNWSVAEARERIEEAERLRRELLARLSR